MASLRTRFDRHRVTDQFLASALARYRSSRGDAGFTDAFLTHPDVRGVLRESVHGAPVDLDRLIRVQPPGEPRRDARTFRAEATRVATTLGVGVWPRIAPARGTPHRVPTLPPAAHALTT